MYVMHYTFLLQMSVSDPPVHIPVPKPRSRYLLRASVEQLFTERWADGTNAGQPLSVKS